MTLEEQVTVGNRPAWVERVVHSLEERRVEVFLVYDPERGEAERILAFYGVDDFKRTWDAEEDPDLLDSLIGIQTQTLEIGTRYYIRLGASEIEISSQEEQGIQFVEKPSS